MNKLSTVALVVILAGTVAACDTTGPTQEANKHIGQRDVYHTLEDCVADWGDTDLCTQQMKEAREHAEKMAAAQAKSGSSGASIVPIFWGPTYYGDTRSVSHNGQTVSPTTSKATRTANIMTTPTGARAISYAAPPKVSTNSSGHVTTVSRGGFGATGSGMSSAG
jgi:uncharacterized protein YgiB involved in biofilm formation